MDLMEFGGGIIKIEDAITDMFAKMGEVQQLHDGTGRIIRDVRRHDYEFKTDIPEFVDSIATPKIQEAMDKLKWHYDTVFYIDGEKHELVTWSGSDWVKVEVNDRILKLSKRYFRELYEKRDK